MAWHLRCAYRTAPERTMGWISSGWTDNQYMTVDSNKENALAIDYPLYASGGATYIKASDHDWYGGADGGDEGGDARWRFWNRARQIVWDSAGSTTSTISLQGLPNIKLCQPATDKRWANWSSSQETTLLLTWEEW